MTDFIYFFFSDMKMLVYQERSAPFYQCFKQVISQQ